MPASMNYNDLAPDLNTSVFTLVRGKSLGTRSLSVNLKFIASFLRDFRPVCCYLKIIRI